MSPVLSTVTAGETFEIDAVADDTVRARLLRLGFLDGPADCRRHVRNGPIVVERNGTELALGASIADQIEIHPPSR